MLCTAAWPVITLDTKIPKSNNLVQDFEKDFIKVLHRARDERRRPLLFVDPSVVENVSHTDMMGLGRVINRHRDLVKNHLRCSYIIVETSFWRNVMRIVFGIAPPTRPVRMAPSARTVRKMLMGAFVMSFTL